MVDTLVFVIAAIVILSGALGVIFARNPVHSALMLIMTLFGVAVLFVAQEAHFLAAVQVIVYAGAIVVLFLFVIMLLGVDKSEDLSIEPFPIQRPVAVAVGVAVAGLVIAAVVRARDTIAEGSPLAAQDDENVKALARNLFQDHVFAFEFTSILLIVAVAGTVLLTRKEPRKVDQ
jgi:NADH-quinone oxidoreductase subunit J